MPIRYSIDHTNKLVEAVADGDIFRKDIEEYLDQVLAQDTLPYAKLWDCSKAIYHYDDADVMVMGARVSAYAHLGPRGPIAIVAVTPDTIEASLRYANLGGESGPTTKVFRTVADARRWLAEQQAKQPS